MIAAEPLITFLISFRRAENEEKNGVGECKSEFNLNNCYLTVEHEQLWKFNIDREMRKWIFHQIELIIAR